MNACQLDLFLWRTPNSISHDQLSFIESIPNIVNMKLVSVIDLPYASSGSMRSDNELTEGANCAQNIWSNSIELLPQQYRRKKE